MDATIHPHDTSRGKMFSRPGRSAVRDNLPRGGGHQAEGGRRGWSRAGRRPELIAAVRAPTVVGALERRYAQVAEGRAADRVPDGHPAPGTVPRRPPSQSTIPRRDRRGRRHHSGKRRRDATSRLAGIVVRNNLPHGGGNTAMEQTCGGAKTRRHASAGWSSQGLSGDRVASRPLSQSPPLGSLQCRRSWRTAAAFPLNAPLVTTPPHRLPHSAHGVAVN